MYIYIYICIYTSVCIHMYIYIHTMDVYNYSFGDVTTVYVKQMGWPSVEDQWVHDGQWVQHASTTVNGLTNQQTQLDATIRNGKLMGL